MQPTFIFLEGSASFIFCDVLSFAKCKKAKYSTLERNFLYKSVTCFQNIEVIKTSDTLQIYMFLRQANISDYAKYELG